MQPLLQVLVGLPGSGKSAFAAKRAEDGAVVVDMDCLVSMLHGGNYQAYNIEIDPVYKAIEMTAITSALLFGLDVVFDKCCQRKSTRSRLIDIGRQLGARVEAVIFKTGTPQSFLERRAKNNGGYSSSYWENIVGIRFNSYQEVSHPDEGFDSIKIIGEKK